MKTFKNYGDYATISKAHSVAIQNRWIARMGWDAVRRKFWIEYVGKAA